MASESSDVAVATGDTLQVAPTGRARCRACAGKIDKGTLRFGEALPSAYGEGDATTFYWFHPRCAAHRRPDKFAPVARDENAAAALPDRERLVQEAELGLAHERLPRLAGAELASSGRARCRHCKELIGQGLWRLRLSSFAASGFFEPLGFIHATCARDYFGVPAITDRLQQAAPDLDTAPLAALITAADPPT